MGSVKLEIHKDLISLLKLRSPHTQPCDLAAGVLLPDSTSFSLKRKDLASESAKSHQSLALAQFMHCHLPCNRIKHQEILPHDPH